LFGPLLFKPLFLFKILAMYNVRQLQACFANLVGFKQPNDPNYPKLSPALTTSTSGKFVQNSHALCSMENIYNIGPEFNLYEYPDWVPTNDYFTGDYTKYEGVVYKYLMDVEGDPGNELPGTLPDVWKVANPFEDWLIDLYNGSVANLVSSLLEFKKLNNVGRSLIESTELFTGFGMLEDKVVKRGRFCGFQIATTKAKSLLVRIDRIGFQCDTVQEVTFYLYHSSQVDPLGTFTVNITRANSFSWAVVQDCMLSYIKGNLNSDGCFYLGYYEDELEGQAIFRDGNLMQPCFSCGNSDVRLFNMWSKHMEIQSIVVLPAGINEDRTLFDERKIGYQYYQNFGINLSLTVLCDLTEFFCTNSAIFADCLTMQICLDILQQIAFNTRMNAISDKTKALAMADLDINLKSGSFKAEYIKMLMALDYDFSGFDSTCLPCNTRKGISYHAW